MPASCANCGKVNREGAMFCQECGQKIDATPALGQRKAALSSPGIKPAEAPICPACGVVNPPGMNFCKMCGTGLAPRPISAPGLAAAIVPATMPATLSGRVTCGGCGKATPTGFAFCQHCGQKLAPAAPEGTPDTAISAPPAAVAEAVAATLRAAKPVAPISHERTTDPDLIVRGRLIVLRRDGTDGEEYRLGSDQFDIGRSDGNLVFADDPFLAARHARVTWDAGTLRIRSLDRTNGVFIKLRAPMPIAAGDVILIGKEVLRYEPLPDDEREPPVLTENGVRLFGTVQRDTWGRVSQLTAAGTTRDIWHCVRPELVLGREEGDVTFPDDEYMSRRHAAVRQTPNGARLEDLGSSNGTFLRIRGDHELVRGDILRLGEQLLRLDS